MSKKSATKKSKKSKSISIGGPKKAKPADITLFTRQLATLLDAGLPLVRSIRILQDQQSDGSQLKIVLRDVASSVEGGKTFSDSLSKYPNVFDGLFVNMVRAGEAGGVLETILNRLADFSEKSEKLKKKVKSAMTYPAVVLSIAGIVVVFLLTFVVPRFQSMFSQQGKELPVITQTLIDISNAMKGFVMLENPLVTIVGIGVIIGAIAGIKFLLKTKGGKYTIDSFKINAPIFGELVKKVIVARFTRTLGTLIASGVPILQALDIVGDAVGNAVVAKAIDNVHASIKEGESIVAPLRESGIFDPMVVGMIDVGEETGTLSEMMIRVADTYDDDVDTAVDGLTSLLEPLLIVFLALIVGTIVIAMFLPLLSLMKGMGGAA
ncbi:type II secretion system F family protein [bacterium]|nr:type II secretion system F family protein [bacterium]